MGDIADWLIEQGMDSLYEYGGTISCRCCGAKDLHWARFENGRWLLVDDECKLHECPVNPLWKSKQP